MYTPMAAAAREAFGRSCGGRGATLPVRAEVAGAPIVMRILEPATAASRFACERVTFGLGQRPSHANW